MAARATDALALFAASELSPVDLAGAIVDRAEASAESARMSSVCVERRR